MTEKVTIAKKNIAVVLAAGSGKRMGGKVRKQYLLLSGYPVIYYSLKTFEESFVDGIVLVVSPGDEEYCTEQIVKKYGFSKIKAVVPGGRERYHSVYEGIKEARELGADHIFIHDGARAFVSEDILDRCLEAVEKCRACVAAVPVKDTVKKEDGHGFVECTLNRDTLWSIQTPQVFDSKLILECYELLIKKEEELRRAGIAITDDTMAVEHFSDTRVRLVMGSYDNIKLTTPEDLLLGEMILKNRQTEDRPEESYHS